MPAPARDVVRDGHLVGGQCPCSYHRWLRDAPADDGPDPDDRYDPPAHTRGDPDQ